MLSTVMTQDDVYFCPGKTQTFSCEVPKQDSLTRLEWKINFAEHLSIFSEATTPITRLFTSADPEGHILRGYRPGVMFMFNLTSNGSSSLSLASVMSVTVDDINATALINNATVNCGNVQTNRKMLYIIEGLSS